MIKTYGLDGRGFYAFATNVPRGEPREADRSPLSYHSGSVWPLVPPPKPARAARHGASSAEETGASAGCDAPPSRVIMWHPR